MPTSDMSRVILFVIAVFAMAGTQAATPSIASGVRHSAALGSDGRVRTWGEDETGVLGVGRKLWSCPAAVPGAAGIVAVSAGGDHALALRDDRTVLAWGNNDASQLGDGTNTRRPTPIPVPG